MQYDLALVAGFLLGLIGIMSLVSAFSGERSLRGTMLLMVAGGGLILYAMVASPTGYRPEDLPQAVLRVIAAVIR